MEKLELTEEDLRNVELKIKIDGLTRIAEIIPVNYYLNKVMPANMTIKKKPNPVELQRYDIGTCLHFGEFNDDTIRRFVEKLEEYSDKINISTLYKNLKSLKITESEISFSDRIMKKIGGLVASGYYRPIINKIHLNTSLGGKSKKTITHELLHLASSRQQGHMVYDGFEQTIFLALSTKARGVNEGTTEFINCFLFNYPYLEASYNDLVYIIKGIANLIGTERLIELYFSNDLKGLEEEISKYANQEVASTLLNGIDKLHDLRHKNIINKSPSTAKELEENLISLVSTLNLKKQKELLKNNEITKEEFDKNYFEQVVLYENRVIVEKINYPIHDTYRISTNHSMKIVSENEYILLTEEIKKIMQDPTISKEEKKNIMYDITDLIQQMSSDMIDKIWDSDNVYGSANGFYDTSNNSLDNVLFNYKNFVSQINKAEEEMKEDITINDIHNIPHTIRRTTAALMRHEIFKSCEADYLNKKVESIKKESELKDMIDDSRATNIIDTQTDIKAEHKN